MVDAAGDGPPRRPGWRSTSGPTGADDRRLEYGIVVSPPPPPDASPRTDGGKAAPGDPSSQMPSHSASLPLAAAAVGLLLIFVLVGWVLFQPSTFTQKLITFGVAAGLMVWVVSVVDGANRRSIDRLKGRLEMQREKAVAEARAEERGRALDAFLRSFVINVSGAIGKYPPSIYSYTQQVSEEAGADAPTRAGPRPNPQDD